MNEVEATNSESVVDESETKNEMPPRLVPVPEGASYRLPDAEDPFEVHLVRVNQAARSLSEQQLAGLFPGFHVDDMPADGLLDVDLARLQRLFDMDLLDRLIDHGVDPARVGLSNWQFLGDVTNSALPGPERVHGAIAGRAISEGGRLTLMGIERTSPGLRRLAEHLGRVWMARVTIQAVAGAGAFSGQTNVILAHNHIIIPVQGFRRVVATMPDGSTLRSSPIGPGEALHLPAGTSVTTTAVNELFVHLEVQIERPLPLSILPLVTALPVAQQTAWADDESILKDSLVAQWCATLPTRPGTLFSSVAGPQAVETRATGWIRPTFTGGWCILVTDDDDRDTVTLVAAGICFRLPRSLLPALALTFDGAPRRISEALAISPSLKHLVNLLVASGLLELLPAEQPDDGWDATSSEPDNARAV